MLDLARITQNKTITQIHNQLDQMTAMRAQLSVLLNESLFSPHLSKEPIEENLRLYDAIAKDLKLYFAKAEFTILGLVQKNLEEQNVNEDIMEEMDLLSLGIK